MTRIQIQCIGWEKLFTQHSLDQDLISKISKALVHLYKEKHPHSKQTNKQKREKRNKNFLKGEAQIAKIHMKK